MTMKLIQTITVGTTPSSMTFTNIPQDFTDLYLVVSSRINASTVSAGLYANFNGDYTAGNYVRRTIYGTGSGAGVYTGANVIALGTMPGNSATANTFGNVSAYIPNYANTTVQKTVLSESVSENNATAADALVAANRWASTAAITEVNIYSDGGGNLQYSTASLYGITKGSGGATVS